MAKEKFERTKPHVNIATIMPKLEALGFTATATRELMNGQMPSVPGDRTMVVHHFVRMVDKMDDHRLDTYLKYKL